MRRPAVFSVFRLHPKGLGLGELAGGLIRQQDGAASYAGDKAREADYDIKQFVEAGGRGDALAYLIKGGQANVRFLELLVRLNKAALGGLFLRDLSGDPRKDEP